MNSDKKEKKAKTEENVTKEKKPFNKKRLKYGSMATAIAVIFIAAVVLINVIISAIGNAHNWKLDITSAKIYEVSDDTLNYLKTLDKDVDIGVTYKESDLQADEMTKLVYEVLEKYKNASKHISLTFFDTTTDPDILQKYQSNYDGEIQKGDIIVECDKRIKTISMQDMFQTDQQKLQYYYYGQLSYRDCVTAFTGEQKLTSAVMFVTDANPVNVAFLNTSNDSPIYNSANANAYTQLKQLFEDNGYVTTEMDAVTGDLNPKDYDVCVLPAPQTDITDDTVDKISKFLENDGNYQKQLLYVADDTQGKTPNIDKFLEQWGLSIDDSIVVESDSQNAVAIGQMAFPVATIADSNYSKNLSNTNKPIVAAYARPINILWDANNERTTSSLLKTSNTSVRYPLSAIPKSELGIEEESESGKDEEDTTEFDAENADKGENTVMASCQRATSIGETINKSTVFAIGSMGMVTLSQTSSLNNGEFIINAVNTATGKDNGITISSKDMSTPSITVKSGQGQLVKFIVYLIPVIILVIAGIVFARRKNK